MLGFEDLCFLVNVVDRSRRTAATDLEVKYQ